MISTRSFYLSLLFISFVLSCTPFSEVAARCDAWVAARIVYFPTKLYSNHEATPYGMVSYCLWGDAELARPSLTFDSAAKMGQAYEPINEDNVRPGDIIIHPENGALVFAGWKDKANLMYRGYTLDNSRGSVLDTVPWLYYEHFNDGFTAFRVRNICNE